MTNLYTPQRFSVALERLKAMLAFDDELALDETQVEDLLAQARVVDAYGYLAEPTRVWEKNKAFKLFELVVPTTITGRAYRCTSAGTSGSSEPAWAASVDDGTITWEQHARFGAWTPTYNLAYAAHRGWLLKAALAASKISFNSEGASFNRHQYFEHCQGMAKFYASQLSTSVSVGSHA